METIFTQAIKAINSGHIRGDTPQEAEAVRFWVESVINQILDFTYLGDIDEELSPLILKCSRENFNQLMIKRKGFHWYESYVVNRENVIKEDSE